MRHRSDTDGHHHADGSENPGDIRSFRSRATGIEPLPANSRFGRKRRHCALPGFGYSLAKGAMEGAKEGFLPAVTGPLEATAAGIGVALAFGYIIALLFNPKSPKK